MREKERKDYEKRTKLVIKRVISMILAMSMFTGIIPVNVTATEQESVYVSVSHDGEFVTAPNGAVTAYVEVPMNELSSIAATRYKCGIKCYDGKTRSNGYITNIWYEWR